MQIHYQWNNILCIRFQNVMIKVVAKYSVSENMALAKNYLVKYDDAICSFYITFFQTMSYLRKHSCCICVSSNRCIVISHFEYYSVYIKRYVFSIRKPKYIRFIRNIIVTTCIVELQFIHLTATTVWLSLHGKILFTCRL